MAGALIAAAPLRVSPDLDAGREHGNSVISMLSH